MPSDYVTVTGAVHPFDLDAVFEVIRGFSGRRAGWTSTVVFDPSNAVFIELRTSPEDVRGNFEEEAVEVTDGYLHQAYGLVASDLARIRSKPSAWQLVNKR